MDAYKDQTLTADDFVFRRRDGQEPMTPSTFTWRFKLILKKNGLPEKLNVHDLRHSYAVASLESGDDIKTGQGNLGHATASFTLDVYGHVSQKMRQQSADRMEQFIHSVSSSKGYGKG